MWTPNQTHPTLIRCWGEECVLYNVASGDTHLIERFAAQLLARLQQGPADSVMLAEHFADRNAADAATAFAAAGAQVDAVLSDFEKYRLIQWDEV